MENKLVEIRGEGASLRSSSNMGLDLFVEGRSKIG
jgi:hypothetical protein